MTKLARKLSLANYFALGFGTMIGTGWVVLMDDWLSRGGPLGAMLGFSIGGLLLLPVGYIYGQWVRRLPDAAGEAAYTAQVFPPIVSYLTGWMMLLAYFIVCPWEAVAVGKLAAYIFPQLDTMELYRVEGQPVFLPRLLLGLGLTLFLAFVNYRGIRASATFQSWATSSVLIVFLVLLFTSLGTGSPHNVQPLFSHAPLASILLTLQIVPYFVTGFESVPKVAEEAHPDFPAKNFFKAIAMALLIGAGFYVLAVGAVSYIAPWQSLLGKRFATAIAFEQGTHSIWLVRLIFAISLVALFQVFNGNFVASSRLIFAFSRRGTIHPAFSRVHPDYLTPTVAIFGISGATLIGLLLGDAILVPVSEVGALAASFGWFAACLSFFFVEKSLRLRLISLMGIMVALAFVLIKVLPNVPGHFSGAEWVALGIWVGIGLTLHRWPRSSQKDT
jgi:APA family basic amino acid/polyamine antiporter